MGGITYDPSAGMDALQSIRNAGMNVYGPFRYIQKLQSFRNRCLREKTCSHLLHCSNKTARYVLIHTGLKESWQLASLPSGLKRTPSGAPPVQNPASRCLADCTSCGQAFKSAPFCLSLKRSLCVSLGSCPFHREVFFPTEHLVSFCMFLASVIC